jgi:hypothetical protein
MDASAKHSAWLSDLWFVEYGYIDYIVKVSNENATNIVIATAPNGIFRVEVEKLKPYNMISW